LKGRKEELCQSAILATKNQSMAIVLKVALTLSIDGLLVRASERGIMTRSEKKRAKNQRIATLKGLEQSYKRIKKVAWAVAKVLTNQPSPNRGIENRLGFCPTCGYWFCYNFGSGITFCTNCIYQGKCLKRTEPIEPLIHAECRECRWTQLDQKMEVRR
jgi:hypothetical protein